MPTYKLMDIPFMFGENKKFRITITGDSNDADYITEVSDITGRELIGIMPIIIKIETHKNKKLSNSHNWDNRENSKISPQTFHNLTDEEYENFCCHSPWGIHSICSIKISEWVPQHTLFEE